MTKETLRKELELSLKQLLRDVDYTVEFVPEELHPLFLLVTIRPHVIGFAALIDSPSEEYEFAYDNFKQLYSKKTKEWSGFDLDLVLCNESTNGKYEEFFNSIELNPYFCRKYVIDTGKGVQSSLSRLPFIPLNTSVIESATGYEGLISCQTFLMQNGVSTNLAKYLSVPYERSVERIVEVSLNGECGQPEWQKRETDEVIRRSGDIKKIVRLRKLEIAGFRAYKGFQEFDLDADLVVLFGPNGYGKTSFFDALDYVCTGTIARFDQRKPKDILKVLKNLDSQITESSVRLWASSNGEDFDILRNVGEAKAEALLKDKRADRKEVLLKLCGVEKEPPDLRIENFVRLFRATHLFGQDFQVLTHMISQSLLPEDTVTRMLALQDYVEAINKSRKVTDYLRDMIKEKTGQIDLLRMSVDTKRKELEAFEKPSEPAETLDAMIESTDRIRQRIEKDIAIQLPSSTETTISNIRDWRIQVVSLFSSVSKKIKDSQELIPQMNWLREATPTAEMLDKQINEKEKLLKLTNDSILSQQDNLSTLEEQKRKGARALEVLLSKQKNLDWALKTLPLLLDVHKELTEVNKTLTTITTEVHTQKAEREGKIQRIKYLEKRVETTKLKLKDLKDEKVLVLEFRGQLSKWPKILVRERELVLQLKNPTEKQADLKKKLHACKQELAADLSEFRTLSRRLEKLQGSQSRLASLLDELGQHIESERCPVCGTVHKSISELREKLKKQKGYQSREMRETLTSHEETRKRVDQLTEQKDELNEHLTEAQEKINLVQSELTQARKNKNSFVDISERLEVSLQSKNLQSIIATKKHEIKANIEKEQVNLMQEREDIRKLRRSLEETANRDGVLQNELSSITTRKKKLEGREKQITEEAFERNISVELNDKVIQQSFGALAVERENRHKRIIELDNAITGVKNQVGELEAKKEILLRDILQIQNDIQKNRNTQQQIALKLRALGLADNTTTKGVEELVKGLSDRQLVIQSIQSELLNLEIMFDAAQKTATVAKLEGQIANDQRTLDDLAQSLRNIEKWHSYFVRISNELDTIQERALTEYIRYYGPLASTIQKRLRPFYGYGDIRLDPSKGGIQLFISRKDETSLPPSDYLSQSQIQILMLSLFLSATLTQNWSSFSPILLDDPVTHFDDLNAYSFMDLVTGLVNGSDGRHQMILSTCEERLYRLMRQKFDKLEKRVVYHVFESYGDTGPRLSQLTN